MKTVFKCIFVTGVAVLCCTQLGCTKDKTPSPPEPCDPDKVYFRNTVLPIIVSNCAKSGCHDVASAKEGLILNSYSGIMKIVKAKQPGRSELIEVINSSKPDDLMPPAPNTPLTQQQKDILSRWISEGALDNYCIQDTASCTTGTVTYSSGIAPLISANCVGCHGGGSVSGGVNLGTYEGVKNAVSSGKLYNAVAQNGQAVPMPPAQKLASCDIKKIKVWIDAGSKNN